MTPEQAAEQIITSDPRFELTEADIRGVRYKVFRNTPANLRSFLQSVAPMYAGKDVLVFQDERWNYPEFCSEVNRLANAMADQLGVRPGDRVAIAMRNYPELATLFMAIVSLGAVAVPLNAWWTEEELAFAVEDCGAKVVFADGPRYERISPFAERLSLRLIAVRDPVDASYSYAQLLDAAASDNWPDAPIAADDDFAVFYSSGSTGHPKGAVLTHRGAISAVYSWLVSKGVAELLGDIDPNAPQRAPSSLIITPLFHVTALQSIFLLGLAAGSKLTLLYKWDAEEAVRVVKAEEVTRFIGVPTQTADLMMAARRLGERLDTLEQIGSGGAKRPAAQVGQLAETFPGVMIGSGWGMTETNALGITLGGPDYLENPDAAGRLTPPLQEMRIVDLEGNDVSTGEVGELIVKSAANMRCYLNQPEATAEALRDGWLYTGDLARLDENGLVYIVDRMKSIIIRGGENISCLEVEGALHHHPDVVEACVFPVPDDRLGETVGAVVLLKPESTATKSDLDEFLAERIARFKLPEHLWLWPESLPRGATGKLDRRAMMKQCLADESIALAQ